MDDVSDADMRALPDWLIWNPDPANYSLYIIIAFVVWVVALVAFITKG